MSKPTLARFYDLSTDPELKISTDPEGNLVVLCDRCVAQLRDQGATLQFAASCDADIEMGIEVICEVCGDSADTWREDK